MRSVRISLIAILTVVVAMPAVAAPKSNHKKFLEDQSIYTEFVQELIDEVCPFPVDVEIEGWAQFKESLTNWHSHLTFTRLDTGKVLRLVDTGPDKVFTKGERMYLSITGRSPTGSGWVGRVVYDMETGDVVKASGKQLHEGDFFQYVCDELS